MTVSKENRFSRETPNEQRLSLAPRMPLRSSASSSLWQTQIKSRPPAHVPATVQAADSMQPSTGPSSPRNHGEPGVMTVTLTQDVSITRVVNASKPLGSGVTQSAHSPVGHDANSDLEISFHTPDTEPTSFDTFPDRLHALDSQPTVSRISAPVTITMRTTRAYTNNTGAFP
jgi:hypothetical protein